jgi:hypothetical protein
MGFGLERGLKMEKKALIELLIATGHSCGQDLAERVDRELNLLESDAMKDEKTSSKMQHGQIAHCSRKSGRCFAKITDTLSTQARSGQRQTAVMLMDAFEGSIGAVLPFVGPCYLGGKDEDCGKVEAFIDDAMAK